MRFEKQLNIMVYNLYQMGRSKRISSEESMIDIMVKDRVRRSIIFNINLSPDELLFYAGSKLRELQNSVRK